MRFYRRDKKRNEKRRKKINVRIRSFSMINQGVACVQYTLNTSQDVTWISFFSPIRLKESRPSFVFLYYHRRKKEQAQTPNRTDTVLSFFPLLVFDEDDDVVVVIDVIIIFSPSFSLRSCGKRKRNYSFFSIFSSLLFRRLRSTSSLLSSHCAHEVNIRRFHFRENSILGCM